jgi:cytochrome c2
MENIESKLLQTKAMLYAMLALLLVVLSYVSFVKTEKPDTGCATKTNEAFCGTESSQSLSPESQKGKELFLANCASCHNKNMKDDLTGPALGGVETRWAAFPRKDLYQFIRGSQAMIKEGHPRAVELWQKHKPTPMNDFPSLTDEDIEALLTYIER